MKPPLTSESFATRIDSSREGHCVADWLPDQLAELTLSLSAPAPKDKVLAIEVPIHSSRQSMLLVEVVFDCSEVSWATVTTGYRTSFVVEWSGWNALHFTVS